jgi:hypothetical protein
MTLAVILSPEYTIYIWRNAQPLKGQCREIFGPRYFSLNGSPGSPDSWAKAVLNIDSNSRRNSIRFDYENRLTAVRHSAESANKFLT